MDLTEAEDTKMRCQEYTEGLYKKNLNDPDNHNSVISHLEADILECEGSDDCFSKRNLWSSSCNSRTLASDPLLESHLTSVYKTCVLCIHLLRELHR